MFQLIFLHLFLLSTTSQCKCEGFFLVQQVWVQPPLVAFSGPLPDLSHPHVQLDTVWLPLAFRENPKLLALIPVPHQIWLQLPDLPELVGLPTMLSWAPATLRSFCPFLRNLPASNPYACSSLYLESCPRSTCDWLVLILHVSSQVSPLQRSVLLPDQRSHTPLSPPLPYHVPCFSFLGSHTTFGKCLCVQPLPTSFLDFYIFIPSQYFCSLFH